MAPSIIRRQEWGARPPRSRSTSVRKHRVKAHWTVTCVPLNSSKAKEAEHMQFLQEIHMDSNGWSDIAYNFVIFPSGRIYEGRGRNVRSAANGYKRFRVPSLNYDHQAIAMVAAPTCDATPAQLESFGELVAAYYPGDVSYHRKDYPTQCPGDQIVKWVEDEAYKDTLTTRGPSYWTWRAWKCGIGPWEGKGQKDSGARYRPRVPRKGSPRWPVWWSRFARSGGCG